MICRVVAISIDAQVASEGAGAVEASIDSAARSVPRDFLSQHRRQHGPEGESLVSVFSSRGWLHEICRWSQPALKASQKTSTRVRYWGN